MNNNIFALVHDSNAINLKKKQSMTSLQFNEYLDKHSSRLYNYAEKLTNDKVKAQDLYQETIYRAYKNRDKFKVGTNIVGWLSTIMKNEFINDYRTRKRKATINSDSVNTFVMDNYTKVKVRNEARSNLFIEELNQTLDTLRSEYKSPFLKMFNGYKYEEIAEMENLPIGTVKSRIHLARKELKAKLNNLYASTLNYN
jgi:RNA polymerase sigma-70 factor (ECF subfamily)